MNIDTSTPQLMDCDENLSIDITQDWTPEWTIVMDVDRLSTCSQILKSKLESRFALNFSDTRFLANRQSIPQWVLPDPFKINILQHYGGSILMRKSTVKRLYSWRRPIHRRKVDIVISVTLQKSSFLTQVLNTQFPRPGQLRLYIRKTINSIRQTQHHSRP